MLSAMYPLYLSSSRGLTVNTPNGALHKDLVLVHGDERAWQAIWFSQYKYVNVLQIILAHLV
jgi:hypothetical protein